MRCIGCFNNSGPFAKKEMSKKIAKTAAVLLKKIGNPHIIITGGEPLFLKNWEEIVGYFSKNFNTTIFSNGTLITKNVALKLKKLKVASVKVSLDSASPAIHDKLRGFKGAYKKTIKGIKNLVYAKIYTIIQSTISKANINSIEKLIKLAKELKVKEIRFAPLRGIGRASKCNILLSSQDLLKITKRIRKYTTKHKSDMIISAGEAFCEEDQEWRKDLYKSRKFNEKEKQYIKYVRSSACDVGIDRFQINYNGDITFCPLITGKIVTIGNIKEIKNPNKFVACIYNNQFSKLLQKPLVEQQTCKFCGFKYLCGGGCRGNGFVITNKINSCDYASKEYLTEIIRTIKKSDTI